MTDADLLAELTNDPVAIGYGELVASRTAEITVLLNSTTTGRTKTIPTPLTVPGVLGALSNSQTAVGDFWTNPNSTTFRDDIRAQDREAVATWAESGEAAGALTSDQVTAIMAIVNATGPVPGSRAEELWGPGTVIDTVQVRRVLPKPPAPVVPSGTGSNGEEVRLAQLALEAYTAEYGAPA